MSMLLLGLLLLLAPDPQGQGLLNVLARPALSGAKVAVVVIDAETGRSLHEQRADEPLMPASNMKVLTTAAAVSLLGADHVFATRLLADGWPDDDGQLMGDLVVVGEGDPCLRTDLLAATPLGDPADGLAELLVQVGVRRIEGRLELDDRAFDREWVHPSWERDDLQRYYAAPIGALSLERNCLSISVDGRKSGRLPQATLQTPAVGYTLENDVDWSSSSGRYVVGAWRPDDQGVVKVDGHVSRGVFGAPLEVPARNASLYFGRSFQAALAARGVIITGGLDDAYAGPLPDVELARVETTLDRALFLANKESDNSVAEHLFKALGLKTEGQGSFASGGRAMESFLRDTVGLHTSGMQLADGSGLSRENRVTARALASTLATMYATPGDERDLFLRSLPVAGLDGTLDERMREAPYRGAVRAKTGYIRGVSSLSGLAWTRSGRVLAFSILINGYSEKYRNRDMKSVQDDLCRELVSRW